MHFIQVPGSVERHSFTAFNSQSKEAERQIAFYTGSRLSRRRQPGIIKRLRHTLTARPIEGQNLTGANSQSKDTTCCCLCPIEGQDLSPAKAQSKDMTLLLPASIEGGQQNANRRLLLPKSKEASRRQIEGCCFLGRKAHFPYFFILFSFTFIFSMPFNMVVIV